MEGQSQSDVRPTETMGRTPDNGKCLTLLNHVVGAVAPDLEHREADTTNHVAELVERDRRTEQRGLHRDPADVTPDFAAARFPVCTGSRDPHRNCLYSHERRSTERDRLPVLLRELSDERLCDRHIVDVEAERRDVCPGRLELRRVERSVRGEELALVALRLQLLEE